MMQDAIRSVPPVVLEPGDERDVVLEVPRAFYLRRPILVGYMEEKRGHYKIKRSRLPLLDARHVTASTTYARMRGRRLARYRERDRRTIVEYHHDGRDFVRVYLPSSVVFLPLDPLCYVELRGLRCDDAPALAAQAVSALVFGKPSIGVGVAFPVAAFRVTLRLCNIGDVRVTVACAFAGRE